MLCVSSAQHKIVKKNVEKHKGSVAAQRSTILAQQPMEAGISHLVVDDSTCSDKSTIPLQTLLRLAQLTRNHSEVVKTLPVLPLRWILRSVEKGKEQDMQPYLLRITETEEEQEEDGCGRGTIATAAEAVAKEGPPPLKRARVGRNSRFVSLSSSCEDEGGNTIDLELFETMKSDLCDMTIQSAALLAESALAREAAGSWNRVLLQYNQMSPSRNSLLEYPLVVLHHSNGLSVIRDLYPKAKVHLLIIASQKVLSACSVRELSVEDVPVLHAMRNLGARLVSHFRALSTGNLQFLPLGFHSTPSLLPMHLHVISADLNSPSFLKKKHHWNSFAMIPSFFLPLDMVLQALVPTPTTSTDSFPNIPGMLCLRNGESDSNIGDAKISSESSYGCSEGSDLKALLGTCISKESMQRSPLICPLCQTERGSLSEIRQHYSECFQSFF